MKLVFAIKTLNSKGGGAERVLASVVNGLALRGHDVTVVTCDSPQQQSFYPIGEPARVVYLGVGDAGQRTSIADFANRVHELRQFLKTTAPEVAIGFMHSIYVPLALAAIGTNVSVVASEHIGPEYYDTRPMEATLLRLTRLTAKRIAVVSEQIRLSFSPWLRKRMSVIHNPVDLRVGARADVIAAGKHPKTVLTVGRLEPQKDHATLIAAFAELASAFPDWELRIVGEGTLRSVLEAQIERHGLAGRIHLAGFTSDVGSEYRNAQLFVLPSLFESFGLVAAEALLHQLPVLGFADCPGTNQLIRHDENGLLVSGPDRVKSLAAALASLMSAPQERARLGNANNDWILSKYSLPAVLDEWENVLAQVSHDR